jgi:hypothetical protein
MNAIIAGMDMVDIDSYVREILIDFYTKVSSKGFIAEMYEVHEEYINAIMSDIVDEPEVRDVVEAINNIYHQAV